MAGRTFTRPDVLVLGAGGILGEAWMSALLAGIEEQTGIDFRRTESLIGTSAGSIVAASLAAGRRPPPPQVRVSEARATRRARGRTGRPPRAGATGRAPRNGAESPEEDYARAASDAMSPGADGGDDDHRGGAGGADPLRRLASGVAARAAARVAPLAPLALTASAPGGALLRAALLAGAPHGTRSLGTLTEDLDRAGARFDGRLRVCCVDKANGRRVVFGAPGAPRARVGEAVAASCAIPSVFEPVRIGGRLYVDGGVWSLTNLDAATVAHDTQVLCLNPTGGVGAGPLSALAAVRTALRAAETVEAAALRRRGARVRVIVPEGEAAEALGFNLMDPRPRARVAGAGYRQGLALGAGE